MITIKNNYKKIYKLNTYNVILITKYIKNLE